MDIRIRGTKEELRRIAEKFNLKMYKDNGNNTFRVYLNNFNFSGLAGLALLDFRRIEEEIELDDSKPKIFKVERKDGYKALFYSNNPNNPISKWWAELDLFENEYYKVYDEQYSESAIFHISNPDEPISDWWYWIEIVYIDNKIFFIAEDKELLQQRWAGDIIKYQHYKFAIFDINNPKEPLINDWFDKIEVNENYLKVKEQLNDKWAIFDINNPKEPVSQWWNWIEFSEKTRHKGYYKAQREDGKWALFHASNPDEPVSKWFENLEDVPEDDMPF